MYIIRIIIYEFNLKGISIVLNLIKRYLILIPLLSGLVHANVNDHKHAFKQVLVVLLFALFPTILFVFWGYLGDFKTDKIIDEAIKTISHGELFMVCTSLLGPVAYLAATEQGPKNEPLLNKTSFSIITLLIIAFSSVAYIATHKNQEDLHNSMQVSLYFFIVTILIFYLANVYQNIRVPTINLKKDVKDKQEALTKDW